MARNHGPYTLLHTDPIREVKEDEQGDPGETGEGGCFPSSDKERTRETV